MATLILTFIIGFFLGCCAIYHSIKDEVLKGRVCFGNKSYHCKED